MANKIILKHGTAAQTDALNGDFIDAGELAVNTAEKLIYVGDGTNIKAVRAGSMKFVATADDMGSLPAVDLTNEGMYYIASKDDTAPTKTFYTDDWFLSTGVAWMVVKISPMWMSGVTNGGFAPLTGGKLDIGVMPTEVTGGMKYKGTWNASNNTPKLTEAAQQGDGWYYIVSADGTTDLNGTAEWKVGDWAVYSSTASAWSKIDNTQESVTAAQVSFTDGATTTDVQAALAANNTATATNTANITTNTAGIATNTTNIAGKFNEPSGTAAAGMFVGWNATDSKPEWKAVSAGSGKDNFVDLDDTASTMGATGTFLHVFDDAGTSKVGFTDTIDGGTY